MKYYFENTVDKSYYFTMYLSPQMMTEKVDPNGYYYLTKPEGKWQPESDSLRQIAVSESGSDQTAITITVTDRKTNVVTVYRSYKSEYVFDDDQITQTVVASTNDESQEFTVTRKISNNWVFDESVTASSKYKVVYSTTTLTRNSRDTSQNTDMTVYVQDITTGQRFYADYITESSANIINDKITFNNSHATRVGDKHCLRKEENTYYLVSDSTDQFKYVDYAGKDYQSYGIEQITLGKTDYGQVDRISLSQTGIGIGEVIASIKPKAEFATELDYCSTISPRSLRYSNGNGDKWQEIYAVFLREQNTTNELSLIWKKPTTDSIVIFESEYPGEYQVDLTQSGYYRITITGGGGGAWNFGEKHGHNSRHTRAGGASGGVFGIIYIDIDDGGTKTLDIKVGAGSGSWSKINGKEINNRGSVPKDQIDTQTEEIELSGMSYIANMVSCTAGTMGRESRAGEGGSVWWEGAYLDEEGIMQQGDIPLLYDTYLYKTIIMTNGEEGTESSQSASHGAKVTEDNVSDYAGGEGPFLGANIPPKRNGGAFTNGGGAGLLTKVGAKTGWSWPVEGRGTNGYVRIEFIYDENMVR